MPPKEKLTFNDLGLRTSLPSTLANSKEQRRLEKIEEKKHKKARVKDIEAQVAASRSIVQQHKAFCLENHINEKKKKEKRKKELRAENLRARNERETEEKRRSTLAIETQQRYFKDLLEVEQERNAKMAEVQRLLIEEEERCFKHAPRNVHVSIARTEKILQERAGLPVLREEQPIMEAINNTTRTCVLICGETGSGKTTQIPQFLWESGYGSAEGAPFGREGCILVTEPRRVAAISMARRVAEELNVSFGREVCYHVRYDNNLSDACRLKFVTEGIALKEIQSDFLLSAYSVIVVDEAHERSVSCDILIGLLSRIVPLRNDLFREELNTNSMVVAKTARKPLRLVIMSATMRVQDFQENTALFPITPPLINVEARRYSVTNHFARQTDLMAYVQQAFKKVCQVHRKLPPGGILVFLCTQQEIEDLCDRLRRHYARTRTKYDENTYNKHALLWNRGDTSQRDAEEDDGVSSMLSQDAAAAGDAASEEKPKDEYGLYCDDYALDGDVPLGDDIGRVEVCQTGSGGDRIKRPREAGTPPWQEEERDREEEEEEEADGTYDTLHVLPLYALLDFTQQQEVFKPPPPGRRLCVIATNVAETSITIPNIRYVVDAGRAKTKAIDVETHASCFRIGWTSQASAEQRSGRAGRMGPGHCYRLYSTAVYSNLMPKHSVPEILRTPLDSVVLLMKHIGIEHVGGFPFPSPPRQDDIKAALNHLAIIGSLDAAAGYHITEQGRALVAYPVPPRFARALVEARAPQYSPYLLDLVLRIVAVCATTTTVFTAEGNRIRATKKDEHADPRHEGIGKLTNPGSDLITYMNAISVFLADKRVCSTFCLVQKSMHESRMLYHQLRGFAMQNCGVKEDLMDTLDTNESGILSNVPMHVTEHGFALTKEDEIALRQIFIPGLLDQVARRASVHECRVLGVEYNDRKTSRCPYLLTSMQVVGYIHPTSAVARTYPAPEYVTYAFLQKVVRAETKEACTCMLGVTIVTHEWLDMYNYSE